MKRISYAALAALSFVMLGSARAQMQMPTWNPGGLYGELGYTTMKVDAFGTSLRPGVLRGILGYEVSPYFAVEGMAGGGVKDNSKTFGINGVPTNIQVNVDYLFGLYVKPRYMVNPQTELFGRLGWSRTKIKAERAGFPNTASEEQDDLGWGLGANYRFTPNFYAGVDWMRYSSQSNTHADGFTVSVGWHW